MRKILLKISYFNYCHLFLLFPSNAFAIHYNDEAIRSLGTFADFLDSLFAVLATDFEDLVKELDQGKVKQDEFIVLVSNDCLSYMLS